jgi:hypothetical protein
MALRKEWSAMGAIEASVVGDGSIMAIEAYGIGDGKRMAIEAY